MHVALEHFAVAAERRHAFLDAGAAGVEQADDRRARAHRHVLDLDDLLRVRLRQRAAEHGEVLGEGKDAAPVDRAPAGDHAVAGDLRLLHAEVVGAVLDEHVELLERVLVHQELDPLARGEFAALVLRVDAPFAAAAARAVAALFEPVDNVLHACPRPCDARPGSPRQISIARLGAFASWSGRLSGSGDAAPLRQVPGKRIGLRIGSVVHKARRHGETPRRNENGRT